MKININSPAYFSQHYGIDDEVSTFCQRVYEFFLDKEYSDTLQTIGIMPVIAPTEIYNKGVWKESVKWIGNKSCAIITIRMDFDKYYKADSYEKTIQIKEMILKAINKVKSKGGFNYKQFEEDICSISME